MAPPPVKATLLALTLNEIDGVRAIMPRVNRTLLHQIIVVDGGSTDGTVEWCRANGFNVFIQKRRGLRHAYTQVMPLVEGDVIVTMSPDGNCPPEAIPLLLDKIAEGHDLVVAWPAVAWWTRSATTGVRIGGARRPRCSPGSRPRPCKAAWRWASGGDLGSRQSSAHRRRRLAVGRTRR